MKKNLIAILLLVIIGLLNLSCAKKDNLENEQKNLNVGFVYVGPVGDGGWNYAHNQGKLEIEELPFIENIYYRENATDTESTLIAIEELVKEGAQLIFTTSYDHKEATMMMAKKYPHVVFESCSTFMKGDNYGSYFGKIHQAWYLAGLAAGVKTESNQIGFIVAHANAECIRISNAFALGVKKTNPEAKVFLEWTHSWYAPSKENLIANKMIDMGCDVIAHNTDSSESQRVADNRDVFSIGYNNDMKDFAPRKNLVCVVWHWGAFYKEAVTKFYNGEWTPQIIWKDIDSGLFGLTEYSKNLTQKEGEIIDDLKGQIITKELYIFTGEIYDNKGNLRVKAGENFPEEDLLTIDWLVDTIEVLNPIAGKE